MTVSDALTAARGQTGPYRKACPICNGIVCKNTVPGTDAKGLGIGFIRNYRKWQEICLHMDTICENKPVDTSFTCFDRPFATMVYGVGKEGIASYISQLTAELQDTMAMCGVHSLNEITQDCVR